MNYDVCNLCTKQGCGGAAKIAPLQFCPLQKMVLQPDQIVLSTNLLFKLDVSLPLVTGELLQNTVDVISEVRYQ